MPNSSFINEGGTFEHTPSIDLEAGDVVVIGDLVAIAVVPIEANTVGTVTIGGQFHIAKAALDIGQGLKVYWDDTAKNITTTVGSNKVIGYTVKASLTADTEVPIELGR